MPLIRTFGCLFFLLSLVHSGAAQPPPVLRGEGQKPLTASDERALDAVDVVENLGKFLPSDVVLRDHDGEERELGTVFDGEKVVILTFAYYSCPMLCGMVLRGLASSLKNVGWTMGQEYKAVTISIDPDDTVKAAKAKRGEMLALYGGELVGDGWEFFTGTEDRVARVAKAAGFGYRYDAKQGQYAHTALVILLTPKGKIARYIYGLKYDPNDLRVALLDTAEGKTLSTVEKLILYCYRYDTKSGKYVVLATRVMQIGGAVTAIFLAVALFLLMKRDKERRRRSKSP